MKRLLLCSTLFSGACMAYDDTPPLYKDMRDKGLDSLQCLAVNSYHEARGESDIANMMVMATVWNRTQDARYPNSICSVVFQKAQYSWTFDKKSDIIHNTAQYKRLYKLAGDFLTNREYWVKLSRGINHYHKVGIKPYWVEGHDMQKIFTIDNHIFYCWD